MKEITALSNKENKSYLKQKVCYIFKKEFSTNDENKNPLKQEIIPTTPVNTEALLIMFLT